MSAPASNIAGLPILTSEGASSFQYRSTGLVASGGLTIPKRNGHRRYLLDVFFEPETAGIMLDVQIGDRVYVRLPTVLGDYTAISNVNQGIGMVKNETVKPSGFGYLQWLRQYIDFDFPTSTQSEDLIITPTAPLGYGALPGTYAVSALYLDTDQGDVTNLALAGGSANARRLWINIVTNSLAQQTTGQTILDTLAMPKGMLGFKDSDLVPPNMTFVGYIYAYDASALGTTTGGNANGFPTRLHHKDTDIEIFTVETQEGLLVNRNQDNSLAFDLSTENSFRPFSPYTYNPNKKITMALDTTLKAGTGANFAATTQAFIIVGIRSQVGQ